VNGQPEYARYNSDALWGSFWNLNQVWSLLYPEQMTAFAKHLLASYRESGWLPDGFVVNRRAPGMLSNQATLFLAAAYTRNPRPLIVRNYGMRSGKTRRSGVGGPATPDRKRWRVIHFSAMRLVTMEDTGLRVTRWSMLSRTGAPRNWPPSLARSPRQTLSPDVPMLGVSFGSKETRCFRPRRFDGSFHTPFDPNGGYSFIEGTALQYRWFVPHNIPALVGRSPPRCS